MAFSPTNESAISMSISPCTSLYEVSSYPLCSHAIFLERSKIQLKPVELESRYNNVAPPFNHHHSEFADDERSMTGDQPPSPRHRTNPMSLSTLCGPPSPHSIPPQLARGSTSNEARMTQSPSSPLSSPPHTPPSPSIEVIDRRPSSPMVPADLTGAPSPLPANVVAESSASTSRKRRRDDSEQLQTPVLPPDEYDERTKTWKHATGFRKDLTADKLTQPDAPTRKKRPAFPRRTATPAAFAAVLAQEPAYSSSQHSGSGESANEEEDELREAADVSPSGRISGVSGTNRGSNDEGATAADIDPDETARLEKKRRQNTQAARRSRIRKAEEVQKLQNRVAELEAEVVAGRHRLTDASRDATRLDVLHRNEVEFTGILKNSILNLVGDQKGSEAIAQATQRWRAITSPVSPSAASMAHLHNEQFSDMEYELETKSGARAGS